MKAAKTIKNLNAAIKAKSLDRVKEILNCGVKPDNRSCFLAIERRAYDILKALIKGGADVNALEPYWSRTPAVKAIKLQDAQALDILLEAGASPNLDSIGGPPLIAAVMKGWLEGAKALVEKGADLEQRCSENTPLIIAASLGHLPLVKLLVEAGANPLAVDMLDRTAYDVAIVEKHGAIAEYLAPLCIAKKPRKKSALELLLDAIKDQDTATFEKHLAAGTDVNGQDKFGLRPLDLAIDVGSVALAKRLIEAGADVNRVDREGNSPLDFAIMKLQTEIIEVLLKAGARPHSEYPLFSACAVGNLEVFRLFLDAGYDAKECSPEGLTPLMIAAQALSAEIVQTLIDEGADVNSSNRDGWTALFNAVFAPSVKCSKVNYQGSTLMWAEAEPNPNENETATVVVKLLLDHGADVNHRNKDGRTPVMYASSPGMVRLLIHAGARLDIRDKQGHDVNYWLKKNGIAATLDSASKRSAMSKVQTKSKSGKSSTKRRRM